MGTAAMINLYCALYRLELVWWKEKALRMAQPVVEKRLPQTRKNVMRQDLCLL